MCELVDQVSMEIAPPFELTQLTFLMQVTLHFTLFGKENIVDIDVIQILIIAPVTN